MTNDNIEVISYWHCDNCNACYFCYYKQIIFRYVKVLISQIYSINKHKWICVEKILFNLDAITDWLTDSLTHEVTHSITQALRMSCHRYHLVFYASIYIHAEKLYIKQINKCSDRQTGSRGSFTSNNNNNNKLNHTLG